MAYYRYQVISVGFWRGQIKRWNTTFHLATASSTSTLYTKMQQSGYAEAGDVVGACSGGVAEIRVYNPTGGRPIAVTTYFDWQNPGSWIPYTGTAWSSVPAGTPLDAAGESALVVVGKLPGLSVTGKPVYTRKYLHAVPSRTAADYGTPDVPTAVATYMKSLFTSSYMGTAAGVTPASIDVDEWYGNHQRVRGRRRTTKQVAAQAFSFGVLAGGGATTSGQGDQFPGGEF